VVGICAAFAGSSDGHTSPAVGDTAYVDGNGASYDTDGDAVRDGRECLVGTNPRVNSPAHRTACAASVLAGDTDLDGLQDTWEVCYWGTLASGAGSVNSDGDALCDTIEAMDVNGNGVTNNTDGVLVKQHFFGVIVGDRAAMDVNGNGVANNTDGVLIQQAFFHVFPSCLP